jgi:hypothetical protein
MRGLPEPAEVAPVYQRKRYSAVVMRLRATPIALTFIHAIESIARAPPCFFLQMQDPGELLPRYSCSQQAALT